MIRPVMKFRLHVVKPKKAELPNDLRLDFVFRLANPEPELDRFEREDRQAISFNRFVRKLCY